jgi:hypothetical protein
MLNQITNKILSVAASQVGVREIPDNKGKDVAKYLAAVGLGVGYHWCMAFVVWCAKSAFTKSPLLATGGVLKQWNNTPLKYRSKTPQPGYIGIIDHGDGTGHTYFVKAVIGKKMVTIEGNTNINGSSNGIGVFELKSRLISDAKGFINLPQWALDVNGVDEKKTIPEKKNI